MAEDQAKENVFRVGICMAGAVSAGAYTAGVMDYLLEALQAYEAKRGQPGFPSYKVEIPVIGGASAGGMTAIITAAGFQQGITPLKEPLKNPMDTCDTNILYHSWVDLTDNNMFAKMLKNDDIETEGGVVSALNCSFIDEIAERTIQPKVDQDFKWKPLPGFFPDKLKLFTTLSNLEGFTYDVSFKAVETGGHRPYYMQLHHDYACFELFGEGITASSKGWMKLDIASGENTQQAMQAAMATGAFPVGLRSRIVSRTQETVNNNPLFDEETRKAIAIDRDPYVTLNVDGGMINNEPFDKVRDILTNITQQKEQKEYENYSTFKSTVLMIAPFPSIKPAAITLVDKLLHVMGLTLSAMISQMRSKPVQVKDAMDPECAGQFLIDPSRRVKRSGKDVVLQGETAIACGALGGFSGFLNKEFRVHDYFLGRHNCKVFLKEYFVVPEGFWQQNAIFQIGYQGVADEQFRGADNSRQIIPIVDQSVDYNFPDLHLSAKGPWPKQPWDAFEQYRNGLKGRIEHILLHIAKYTTLQRILLWLGSRVVLRRMLTNVVMNTLKVELSAWGLIIGASEEKLKP
jgi:hypothetical protein